MSLTAEERARYSRHLTLSEVGEAGQERLRDSSVLVVGAGGLGSPCLLYLAAAGVGRIGIMDDDRVEESNLQRQILHGTSGLRSPKARSAAARLSDLNPHVQLEVFEERLDLDNALETLRGWDVVVDGSDNFATRYLVNDACEILGIPFVYGAIQRFEGQVSVFNHQGGPTYRDLFPQPPPPELAPNCAEAGVLGVLPGVVGTLQATEAIKVLLGQGRVLSGRLLLYDALRMTFDELALVRDPAREPVLALTDVEAFCAGPPPPWRAMEPAEVVRARLDGWTPFVFDVRTAAEASVSQLEPTDLRVTHTEVLDHLAALPASGDILVYCRAGGRSARVCNDLVSAGIAPERLVNLDGGLQAWSRQIDPSMRVA